MSRTLILLAGLFMSLSVFGKSVGDNADTIVVAQDGTGHCQTISEAISRCLPFRDYHKVIFIRKGVYAEKVDIPSQLTNVELLGESRDETVISFDDHAKKKHPMTGRPLTTFGSSTLRIQGQLITLKNLTVENSTVQHTQAVALHTDGDRIVFVNCRFLGCVDTIYTGTIGSRLYFQECYIEGTLDFIFGPATVWFERCTLHSKSNEYVTAASTPSYQEYGYIFNHCTLTAAPGVHHVYLGRPWRSDAAYTVFMNCSIGNHIVSAGWHDWGRPGVASHVRYYEYNNTGEGSGTVGRVPWAKKLSKRQAKRLTRKVVFRGSDFYLQ